MDESATGRFRRRGRQASAGHLCQQLATRPNRPRQQDSWKFLGGDGRWVGRTRAGGLIQRACQYVKNNRPASGKQRGEPSVISCRWSVAGGKGGPAVTIIFPIGM